MSEEDEEETMRCGMEDLIEHEEAEEDWELRALHRELERVTGEVESFKALSEAEEREAAGHPFLGPVGESGACLRTGRRE